MISGLGIVFVTLSSIDNPIYQSMDIGPRLRKTDLEVNLDSLERLETAFSSYDGGSGASVSTYSVGDLKVGLWYDDTSGLYLDLYEIRAIGTHAEVWVAVDLSWPDPEDPRPEQVITDEQVDMILGEYDNNIHPELTSYFGTPDFHDGSAAPLSSLVAALVGHPNFPWITSADMGDYTDSAGRTIIMVSNIGDESYYDPTYPYYIAGFYWGTYEYYFNRNIVNIDTWNFDSKPSTLAHELQHLIHADWNPGDATFMNEGCSVFSEMLCGYGIPWSDINSYLTTPDNSLIEWGDQGGINILADYGAAGLWAIYLNDRFGDDFLGDFVQSGLPGIYGLNVAFMLSEGVDFYQVYHDWRIANLIHWGDGVYNYKSIDLGSKNAVDTYFHKVLQLPVPWMTGSDFGSTITILGYDTGFVRVKPFGTDYIRFDSGKYISKAWDETLYFDGYGSAIVGWQDVGGYWWSDDYDLMNTLLVGEAYVNPENPILELTTYWDIEDNWDFGFVQIYNSDTATWESLENEYTTDYHEGTHPDIVANLPGITGWSEDIVTINFDLSAYAGETVQIGFRYMTDWYTTYEGWYIFDASVSGQSFDLAPADVYPPAYFQVSIIYELKGKNKWASKYTVIDLDLDSYQSGQIDIEMEKPSYVFLVVSPIQPAGHVDYSFHVTTIHV